MSGAACSAAGFDTTQSVSLNGDQWEFTGGVLGRGAFGVVFDARCAAREERAAVKVIDMQAMSIWQARQSVSEIALWSRLQHPSIVRFIGHTQLNQWLLLFSEPLDGGELMDYIVQSSIFVEAEAASILRQLLSAIAYLHEGRVCHRDIKPQNVVCAERPESGSGEWRHAALGSKRSRRGEAPAPSGYSPRSTVPERPRRQPRMKLTCCCIGVAGSSSATSGTRSRWTRRAARPGTSCTRRAARTSTPRPRSPCTRSTTRGRATRSRWTYGASAASCTSCSRERCRPRTRRHSARRARGAASRPRRRRCSAS